MVALHRQQAVGTLIIHDIVCDGKDKSRALLCLNVSKVHSNSVVDKTNHSLSLCVLVVAKGGGWFGLISSIAGYALPFEETSQKRVGIYLVYSSM